MKQNFSRSVSYVVSFVDDVTNKTIKENCLKVYIEGERLPVFKKEGYYVFMDMNVKTGMLIVISEGYESVKQVIDFSNYNLLEPMKIRLYPNRKYPFKSDPLWIEGKVSESEKDSETNTPTTKKIACIYTKEIGKRYRLLQDYKPGSESQNIMIFHPEGIDLEHKMLWIRNIEEEKGELLRIQKCVDQKERTYQIAPLKKSYKKSESIIHDAYIGDVREEGLFFIPISEYTKIECTCYCEIIEKEIEEEIKGKIKTKLKEKIKEFDLKPNTKIKIIF